MFNNKGLLLESYKNSIWCLNTELCESGHDLSWNKLKNTEIVISYTDFKNKFLNTDIFKESDSCIYDNFFEGIIPYIYNKNIKFINMSYFLYGYCDVFAYLLSKRLGYDIITYNILDEDGELSDLVHAFCATENHEEYLDIRGISSSGNMSSILSYCGEVYWESLENYQYEINVFNADKAKEFFIGKSNLEPDRYSDDNKLVKEINQFIELFIEKYDAKYYQ